MDLEEQRLKQRIDVREAALKEKIAMFKGRVEHLKHMGDVKSQAQQRPVLMFTGSVLAGILTKKLLRKKNHHSRYNYDSRPSRRAAAEGGNLWASATAILSAIMIRAGTAIITDIIKKPTHRDGRR
jgi:hypothetical protein